MNRRSSLMCPALLCASIALANGGAFAATASAARTVSASRPVAGPTNGPETDRTTGPANGVVKAGVDAWSAGDYASAVRLWQPLADAGDPDAQFNLAQAYKLGRGVPVDLTRAEDLYGKAAANGHVQAADSYGLLLFQRGERQKALPYVQAAASRGDARAMYILGVAHFNGDIVAKDWVRAYALASLARDAGLEQATRALAQMDQYVPLPDRQKSVVLAQQLTAEAQANRQRLATSAELGRPSVADATPSAGPARPAEVAAAEHAVAEAVRVSRDDGPAFAGADYTRAKPPAPRPAPPKTPPAQSTALAPPPATKPAPKPAPQKPAAAPPPASTGGPWRVQLGAFGVPGNADALWARVRARPELSGHPKALVPAGKLTKLQATGFASSSEAQAACSRLAGAGLTCLPIRD